MPDQQPSSSSSTQSTSTSTPRRLLVAANQPPPPIPPRLLSRIQQQQQQRQHPQQDPKRTPAPAQWIDRAEFGTAAHHWHPGAAPNYPSQPMPYGPPISSQPPLSYHDHRHSSKQPSKKCTS